MKSAYALAFLGLCAVVLVLHVYDTPEQAKESHAVEDPFLAALESHVVATAQRRLKQRRFKEASEAHISEARKAMKSALLDAQSSNLHRARKIIASQEQDSDSNSETKNKEASSGVKKFTWAELQAGADVKEKSANEDDRVGGLVSKLKAAPHMADSEREDARTEHGKVDMLAGALETAKAEAHVDYDEMKARPEVEMEEMEDSENVDEVVDEEDDKEDSDKEDDETQYEESGDDEDLEEVDADEDDREDKNDREDENDRVEEDAEDQEDSAEDDTDEENDVDSEEEYEDYE